MKASPSHKHSKALNFGWETAHSLVPIGTKALEQYEKSSLIFLTAQIFLNKILEIKQKVSPTISISS